MRFGSREFPDPLLTCFKDDILLEARRNNVTFKEIGKRLNRSTGACGSRHQKLIADMESAGNHSHPSSDQRAESPNFEKILPKLEKTDQQYFGFPLATGRWAEHWAAIPTKMNCPPETVSPEIVKITGYHHPQEEEKKLPGFEAFKRGVSWERRPPVKAQCMCDLCGIVERSTDQPWLMEVANLHSDYNNPNITEERKIQIFQELIRVAKDHKQQDFAEKLNFQLELLVNKASGEHLAEKLELKLKPSVGDPSGISSHLDTMLRSILSHERKGKRKGVVLR